VVEAAGFTVIDPASEEEVNVPGVIDTESALVTDQLRVEVPPTIMFAGVAEKEAIPGGLIAALLAVAVKLLNAKSFQLLS
jgi:hypothetical protein